MIDLQSLDAKSLEEQFAKELQKADEQPIWVDKAKKMISALLSVLIPLRDSDRLFTPELKPSPKLDEELFLSWCDLSCMKVLAFELERQNSTQKPSIQIEELATYLASYGVDLQDELKDFPIAHYNLHMLIKTVIKRLFYAK